MASIKSCLVSVPAHNTPCVQLDGSSVHEAAARGLASLTKREWRLNANPDTEIVVRVDYRVSIDALGKWLDGLPQAQRRSLEELLRGGR